MNIWKVWPGRDRIQKKFKKCDMVNNAPEDSTVFKKYDQLGILSGGMFKKYDKKSMVSGKLSN